MKKKLIAVFLCVALVAVGIVGATLAYFTDTDTQTNTFTVGNVTIDLIEKERKTDEDGNTTLGDFTQGQKLYPIAGSAQGERDEFGQPTAKFYVDKIVTVKNTGSEAAYIRAYFAIPSVLDDGYETFNAGLNVLHFNFGDKKVDGNWVTTEGDDWIWEHTDAEGKTKWNYYETTIDGIAYNVYFADYATTVAAGTTTEQFVKGVYLDTTFNSEVVTDEDGKTTTQYYVMNNGAKTVLDLPENWNWSKVACPVFAVAVQAEGFASANEAITAAFGTQYNPWGGTVNHWQ